MKTKNLVIAIATLGIIFTSCSSDDDNNSECTADYIGELSASEEKLVGTWILTGLEAEDEIDLTDDDTDNPSADIFSQFTECQKDKIFTFNAEREMEALDGTTATNCSDEETSIHQWKMENNRIYFIHQCLEFYMDATFNGDNSSFTFESNIIIKDVEGENVTTTVTYEYTKEVD